MAKRLLLLWMFLLITAGCFANSDSTSYVLIGKTDFKTGMVILNDHVKKDTLKVTDGSFVFRGTINKPVLALLEIYPSGGIPIDIILEPGTITVTGFHGKYTIGGTYTNRCYQKIHDELTPFRDAISILQDKSYAAQGEEKRKLLSAIDSISQQRIDVARVLVKANVNYAGLLALQSIYRKEKPSNLVYYLNEFKLYQNEQIYQVVADYYKNMLKVETGFPVPALILPDLNGQMISLASFKGKFVLVDFWYHNCIFCRKMAPALVSIYADLKKKGLEIVSVSIDGKESEKPWREAIKADGATWTELWDNQQIMPKQYGVVGYPNLYLLDRNGNLLHQMTGYQSEKDLRSILGTYIH